jgi:hypothetical protein
MRRVRGLEDEREVLEGQVRREARPVVTAQHLVRPVDPELAVGRGGAVQHLQRPLQVEAEGGGQRQRLRVELAGDDGEVVVDQLRARPRAGPAAVVHGGPHRLQQRPDPGEVDVAGADHEQRLAPFRVLREPPHGRVHEGRAARGAGGGEAVRRLRVHRGAVHHQPAGAEIRQHAVGAEDRLQHLPRSGEHGDDHVAPARDLRRVAGGRGAEGLQRLDGGGGDVVHRQRKLLPAQVGRHAAAHVAEADEADPVPSRVVRRHRPSPPCPGGRRLAPPRPRRKPAPGRGRGRPAAGRWSGRPSWFGGRVHGHTLQGWPVPGRRGPRAAPASGAGRREGLDEGDQLSGSNGFASVGAAACRPRSQRSP